MFARKILLATTAAIALTLPAEAHGDRHSRAGSCRLLQSGRRLLERVFTTRTDDHVCAFGDERRCCTEAKAPASPCHDRHPVGEA